MSRKRQLVEPNHEQISLRRQCRLLGLHRSGFYYKAAQESGLNLQLMRLMGLMAVYRKPRLSQPAAGAQIYPYLLRDVKVDRVDQVWSTEIT